MLCRKFGKTEPIILYINALDVFFYYLSFYKGEAFHLNNFDGMCQVWLKLAQCF